MLYFVFSFSNVDFFIIFQIMNSLVHKVQSFFATLAIAEHNGKNLTKNTLKLLSASQKLKEDVF